MRKQGRHGPVDLSARSATVGEIKEMNQLSRVEEEYRRWDRDLADEKEAWRLALERAEGSASWLLRRLAALNGQNQDIACDERTLH